MRAALSRGPLILDEVWGMRIQPDTNVVDVHIYRLRGKVDTEGVDPSFERCEVWAMFSKTAKPIMRRRRMAYLSVGHAGVRLRHHGHLHISSISFVAGDIQRRTDAWLAGEAGVLSDVAERTPKRVETLYRRVVGEVAELASRGAAQAGNRIRG